MKEKKEGYQTKGNMSSLYSAIRYFIVDMVIKSSSDEATLYNERTFINKLNMVLVQVKGNKHQKVDV